MADLTPGTPVTTGVPAALQAPGSTQSDPAADILARYNEVNSDPNYSYVTGGPNQALINQLNQTKERKLSQYKTNRADAETIYGELTTDVAADTTALVKDYTTAITDTGTRATDAKSALSKELAAQQTRRDTAAKELGIEREMALTPFASDTSLNDSMSRVLQSGQSWQALLESQKLGAQERGTALGTATKNTKNKTVLAMKQAYDQAKEQLNQQIAAERSKTGTRKLTEIGQMLSKGYLGQLKDYTFGGGKENPLITKENQNFDYFVQNKGLLGDPTKAPGGAQKWYADNYAKLMKEYNAGKLSVGKGLSPELQKFADVFGLKATTYPYATGVVG